MAARSVSSSICPCRLRDVSAVHGGDSMEPRAPPRMGREGDGFMGSLRPKGKEEDASWCG